MDHKLWDLLDNSLRSLFLIFKDLKDPAEDCCLNIKY